MQGLGSHWLRTSTTVASRTGGSGEAAPSMQSSQNIRKWDQRRRSTAAARTLVRASNRPGTKRSVRVTSEVRFGTRQAQVQVRSVPQSLR